MRSIRLTLALVLAPAFALGGCGSQPVKALQRVFQSAQSQEQSKGQPELAAGKGQPELAAGKGQPELAAGIQKYEDGKYVEAATRLQAALAEGLSPAEEVKAHKYLAFIHCASRREKLCRSEFRKALDKDPAFQLEAAEAGHPIWGPVFRSVKDRG